MLKRKYKLVLVTRDGRVPNPSACAGILDAVFEDAPKVKDVRVVGGVDFQTPENVSRAIGWRSRLAVINVDEERNASAVLLEPSEARRFAAALNDLPADASPCEVHRFAEKFIEKEC